ncbi:MAG: hypothetical protein U1F43_07965 [Myxococcota bacterium]
MGLAFGACSHETKKDNTPAFVAAPDGEAIVGSWSDGANTFTFDGNLNYRMEKEIPCGKPPCPTTATTGTYKVAAGRLVLDPPEGNDILLNFGWADNQKTVNLTGEGGAWTLHKR